MQEEKDDKDEAEEEVRGLEELVVALAEDLLLAWVSLHALLTYRIERMDMTVNHACASNAMTPVSQRPSILNISTISPAHM